MQVLSFFFLKGVYKFKSSDIFAFSKKRILKFVILDKLEFRCSYLHSNMSLRMFLEKWKVESQKTFLDYSKTRYPWTQLEPDELYYGVCDVCGLVEAIKKEMVFEQDNLYTIPLTSTGYVRRDVKVAMRSYPYSKLKAMLPDYDDYVFLRAVSRGGNVHANRYYSGEIMDNVYCDDRQSSYPDVQLNDKFPMSKFLPVESDNITERTLELIDFGYAVMFEVVFTDLELKDKFWPIPYLAKAKGDVTKPARIDNGRILECKEYHTFLTDIDFRIVDNEYKWKSMYIIKAKYAKYGYLPEPFKEVIRKYYKGKTELKGVEDMFDYYMKSKNLLNSNFGMTFTKPVRDSVIFNSAENDFDPDKTSPEEKLVKYNRTAFLSYAWGVWTTAWGRYRLEEGLEIVYNTPGAILLYCDTDGIYHTGNVNWEAYNNERIRCSKKNLAYAYDRKGKCQYMGIYDSDGLYKKFCTMGCKKYVGMKDGALHITIAGVRKETLCDDNGNIMSMGGDVELRDISNFKRGFVFREAAGNLITYNNIEKPYTITIDGHEILITSNVTVGENTYTIKNNPEYEDIIAESRRLLKNLLIQKGIQYEQS